MPEHTLHARHEDGRDLVFNDYVDDGAQVDLFADPDEEREFQGACVVYRRDGDWRARSLTEAEVAARTERILRQAQDRSLPREERLGRDPVTETGTAGG